MNGIQSLIDRQLGICKLNKYTVLLYAAFPSCGDLSFSLSQIAG